MPHPSVMLSVDLAGYCESSRLCSNTCVNGEVALRLQSIFTYI